MQLLVCLVSTSESTLVSITQLSAEGSVMASEIKPLTVSE